MLEILQQDTKTLVHLDTSSMDHHQKS